MASPSWSRYAYSLASRQDAYATVQLTEDTHKFESMYMQRLLGGTPQEIPDVYRERSPVHRADRIRTPLLVRAPASLWVFVLIPTPSQP
jgi:dipeptidyl aminopeptidase/acylaminoacyl peptidase